MQIQSTILQDVIHMKNLELKNQKEKRNIIMCSIVKIVDRLLLENGQANLPKTTMRIDVVNVVGKLSLMQKRAIVRF